MLRRFQSGAYPHIASQLQRAGFSNEVLLVASLAAHGSSLASWAALIVQVASVCGLLSLFQRERHV